MHEPPHKLTIQQAIDIAFTGVLSQPGPAWGGLTTGAPPAIMMHPSTECKCPLGHLVPKELYKREMERNPVHSTHLITGLPKSFLFELAFAHDYPAIRTPDTFRSSFIKEMKRLADKYDATLPDPPPDITITGMFWEKFREAWGNV